MRYTHLFTLSALLLPACAPSRVAPPEAGVAEAQRGVYAATEVDVPPRRLGCSGYATPPVIYQVVFLEYVVDASGNVQPGSVRPASSQPQADGLRGGIVPRPPAAGAATAARKIAPNCTYEPARKGDEAVSVRIVERFTF